MPLSIITRKTLKVLNSETLTGIAGDAINDNFYTLGDQQESTAASISSLNNATGALNTSVDELQNSTGVLEDEINILQSSTGILNGYIDNLNIATGVLEAEINEIQTGDADFYGDVTYHDTFWDDLRVPLSSTKKAGSKEPEFKKALDNGLGSQGVMLEFFDKTTEEELYFECQMPHSWKEGTDIHAHVHFIPIANGSEGDVVSWCLEYSWASIGSVFSNTTIIGGNEHIPADSSLVQNKHYLTELGEINGSGQTFSSMLICRVFRDAGGTLYTDDYDDEVGLLEIDFHYEIDKVGTDEEYSNN